ncbi:MAG: DUF4209 domain-containing protein [Deltaproteobacteria bacterium]|nr:DUF4209 domain-containing protein [Deltaproteobacteria bacterium]
MNILDALEEALIKFDHETEPISERDVAKAIRLVGETRGSSEVHMQLVAESMAFDFCEDYSDKATGWGTYYGPMFVFNNGDGTATEAPSVKRITEEIINYWTERAKSAKHPILRVRYADLVWDFQKLITQRPPHYSMAQIVIDSTIEVTQRNCHSIKVDIKKKLDRALSLAIALNDGDRVQKVAAATIAYEDTVTDDSKLGLWGFAYDMLFDNDKVKLSDAQRQKLIDDLEGHLQRASDASNSKEVDPWAVESTGLRLARHYRKIGSKEDTERVIMAIRDAFVQASSKASALQASAWLQRVHTTLKEYGFSDEADKISIQLREVGKRARSELKSFSYTMEVPKEKVEEYIATLTAGELEDALTRIIAHYIPQKSEVEKQLKDLAGKAPIAFLIPIELQDDAGRPLAKVGSLEDDLPGQTVKQMSQNLDIEAVFLRHVLESLVKQYPAFADRCVDYLFRSPIFKEDRRQIIQLGIEEYAKGNHMAAVHLLIPQIEHAIRVLVETAGGSVLKPTRGGGFHLKVLDDLLRDPILTQVFREDIVFYFSAVLVDQRGWNLRNCVCHGISDASDFGPRMSDRIFHILLCLGQVRKKNEAE